MEPTDAPSDEVTNAPMDETAFQAALTFLLGEAHDRGIDVEGHWSCATHESLPDWKIEVFEFADDR